MITTVMRAMSVYRTVVSVTHEMDTTTIRETVGRSVILLVGWFVRLANE